MIFRTDILPCPQRRLWNVLDGTPPGFVLYGGTALALRLGHRESLDFDFFSNKPFDAVKLHGRIPYLEEAMATESTANSLTCVLDLGGPVKVSFFGGLGMRRIREPDRAEGSGILVASLLDVAATKALAVQQRATRKDYVDVDALLQSGISLPEAIGAARAVFGSSFNPVLTLKALSFFGEGDLETVPQSIRKNLCGAVKAVKLDDIPEFPPCEFLCPTVTEDGFRHVC